MKHIRRYLSFELLNKLYVYERLSSKEIAEKLNIPICTIQWNLKKLGVPIRSLSEATRLKIEKSRDDPNFRPHRYQSGEGHWNWSGGRYKIQRDGYVYVYAPGHPRASKRSRRGAVREHIIVWEKTHNRLLPIDWIIHHLNGIKDDNRPENLLAMPRKCHHADLLLQALKKRVRGLESENKALKAQLTLGLKTAHTP